MTGLWCETILTTSDGQLVFHLKQQFSNCGTGTTGGTQAPPWWYVTASHTSHGKIHDDTIAKIFWEKFNSIEISHIIKIVRNSGQRYINHDI